MRLNENYANLKPSYLFSEIAHRVNSYCAAHPENKLIRMGIGDVTRPLAPLVVEALKKASEDQGQAASFHGYGPEQGYDFLRTSIQEYYGERGVELALDEIFVSDGAKSDTGNITDLFDKDNVILVPDPVYPVYVDTNLMNGRKILYMNGTPENGFLPLPEDISAGEKVDIVYLCSPNNPTGAAYNREQLEKWVTFCLEHKALLLFDAAYEAFVSEENLPRSIFEIKDAKKCAIEFGSLSKTAGFTGTRCGYTIVPKDITCSENGEKSGLTLNGMWLRRQTTKFNGVSYVIQKGAAAAISKEGMAECQENIHYYRENASIIAETLAKHNVRYFGGVNSPYIWFECPGKMDSWDFFDKLLNEAEVVGTPGAGFGAMGKCFFRLTAFSTKENTQEAMERLEKLL